MVIRRILGLIGTSVFAIPAILGSPCRPQKAGLASVFAIPPSWAAHAAPRKPGWLMTELIW